MSETKPPNDVETRLQSPSAGEASEGASNAVQRDSVVLAGARWGAPRVWSEGRELARVKLRGDADDGACVDEALQVLDAAWPGCEGVVVFLLGYEAACALDPRMPRKARLGHEPPDVLVRHYPTSRPWSGGAAGGDLEVCLNADAQALHEARVLQAREALLDGVIYQANLAHGVRAAARTFDEGVRFFAGRKPPPCAALLDDAQWGSLVSLSPERFLTFDLGARFVETFPIKGTRPRGLDDDDDRAQLEALCASEKDAAEHVMIVDLLRNDLGKVAVPGGVTVSRLMSVVSVSNVHHLESCVEARMREGVGLRNLLRATAPGGSITGAPKSSAVDVIHALEAGPRGAYTGILGVVDGQGRGTSSLLIRTWMRPDVGEGSLHVGGGIVVDSEPTAEWNETLDKAAGFARLAR